MKNKIIIETPKGSVTAIVKNNIFYIGEKMFLFIDIDNLIEIAANEIHQQHERRTDTKPMRNVVEDSAPQ